MTVTPIFDDLAAGAAAEHDDAVGLLLAGARREVILLGGRQVGTVHLALAAVRAGGDVGRAFGMRGVGPAVLLAALGDSEPVDPTGGDPLRPGLSAVARTVLHRVAHRAAREDRAVTTAELAVAVARTGRVADLLARHGVDLDDLADALTAGEPAAPTTDTASGSRRRRPVPVGVVGSAPARRPAPAATVPDRHAVDVPA